MNLMESSILHQDVDDCHKRVPTYHKIPLRSLRFSHTIRLTISVRTFSGYLNQFFLVKIESIIH
jgi:hypothetical protein